MSEISEAELIARVMVDGDHHAFELLIKRFQSQLRNYCRRLSKGDLLLADDVAQETFITAHQKIRSFTGKGKFVGWLLQIAYRHFLQDKRKQQPDYQENLPEPTYQLQHDNELLLEQVMKTLSPEQSSAITLNMTMGFSHQEVADIMSLPIGTVKSHITRGVALLREQLQPYQQGVA